MKKYQKATFYKVRHAKKDFLCALCKAPRQLSYGKNLDAKKYAQILIINSILGWMLFPVMKEKVVFMFFLIWFAFEVVNKMLYRRQIPCPYCGFDATWYRKDVTRAREKVADFWAQQNSLTLNSEDTEKDEEEVSQIIRESDDGPIVEQIAEL